MGKEIPEIEKWKQLRISLKSTYDYDGHWKDAIDLFNMRLENKFIGPIGDLVDFGDLSGEGFSIVTIQCALIESLAAFRLGKIFNYQRSRNSPSYEYSRSKDIFTDFLHDAPIFENVFWITNKSGVKETDKPFSADDFYSDVRCGLMHEARTKGNWIITAGKSNAKTEKVFLESDGDKIKILRNVLHHRLIEYIEQYSNALKENSDQGKTLRRYFARKLDHLFDITQDPANYDWWIDP
jgi:hypothetical protein